MKYTKVKKRIRVEKRAWIKPLAGLLLLALVISVIPGVAQADREVKLITLPASDSSKREVVYARLKATGDVDNIYVVNHFQPSKKVPLKDHGDYQEVIQLTGDHAPVLNGTTVSIAEAEGPYYYQGNLKSRELPWKISISWKLNGEKKEPDMLSGAKGELEFELNVKQNEVVNSDFFKQYALQISIPIDPERTELVAASEGFMVSYAGAEHQLTYIALPGKETTIKAVFRVDDFAMGQMTLAGIPLSFDINLDDFEEFDKMLAPLGELSSGIADFSEGASKLRQGYRELLGAFNKVRDGGGKLVSGGHKLTDGANQLKGGVDEFTTGVDRYVQGVKQLSNGYKDFDQGVKAMFDGTKQLKTEGEQLKDASGTILEGLNQIVSKLPPADSFDGLHFPDITPDMIAKLDALANGSLEFRDALARLASNEGGVAALYGGLKKMREQLVQLKTQADQFVIPSDDVQPMTAEQWKGYIASLGFTFSGDPASGADVMLYNQLAGMSQLAAGYKPAVMMLRGTIDNLLDPRQGVPALEQGAKQLLDGLRQMSASYGGYHNGTEQVPGIHDGLIVLVNQMKALASLSEAVAPLISGYPELVNGLRQLQAGYAGVYDANGKPVVGSDGKPMIGFHRGLETYIDAGIGGLLVGYKGAPNKPGLMSASDEIKNGLATLAQKGQKLSSGGGELKTGASKTGQGIADYVSGVSSLKRGLDRYRSDGLIPYSDGLKQYAEGADKLKEETNDLPKKFEDAVRDMLQEYQDSFVVQSFVSDENKDVTSVQFVLMTEEIPPLAK